MRACWATVALSGAVLIFVFVCGTAAAAGTVLSPSEVGSLTADVGEVEAYEEEFGVPTDTAEERLAVQSLGAGIVAQLQSILGEEFAGVWFDNESGQFVVPLVATANRARIRASLDRAHLAGLYRIRPAEDSWAALEATQKSLDGSLHDLRAASLVQTFLDPRTNAVVVREAADTGDAAHRKVRDLSSERNVAVEIRQQTAARFGGGKGSCYVWTKEDERFCGKPLRGGISLEPSWQTEFEKESEFKKPGIDLGVCTAGFKATRFGDNYILTAGHCYVDLGTHWRSSNANESGNAIYYVGAVQGWSFPGSGDWAKIRVSGSTHKGDTDWWEQGLSSWPSEVVSWGEPEKVYPALIPYENKPIEYESSSFYGQLVCHSGSTTGTTCGTVTRVDVTQTYDGATEMNHLTAVEGPQLCAKPGDSGGPVFAGNKALGLYSGQSPGCGNNAVMWFVDIIRATEALEVTVGPKAGAPPYAETGVAPKATLRKHEAFVEGKVDPNGLSTKYYIEYWPASASGLKATEPAKKENYWDAGSAWQTSSVGRTINGLHGSTEYSYRMMATNAEGTVEGPTIQYKEGPYTYTSGTFKTLESEPAATVVSATNPTSDGATLHGTVTPEQLKTTYSFRWGKFAYGFPEQSATQTITPSLNLSEPAIFPVNVETKVSGLIPGKTYQYQVVATNSVGTTYSETMYFTTQKNKPVVILNKPSNVTQDKASLTGSIDPEGLESSYYFIYYPKGSGVERRSARLWVSGNSPVNVSEQLTCLLPNTTYFASIFAENGAGWGADSEEFTTKSGTPSSCFWTYKGMPIKGTQKMTLTGDIGVTWGAYGKFSCKVGGTAELGPMASGKLTALNFNLGECTPPKGLSVCTVSSASASVPMPIDLHGDEATIPEFAVQMKFGGKECPLNGILVKPKVTLSMAPDNPDAISAFMVSGAQVPTFLIDGTLALEPASTLGIFGE